MVHCNKVGGGKKKSGTRKRKQMKGGSHNMAGSPYQGQGPVVQQGTPYVGFNLSGNTSEVAGSYAPLAASSHQCGGKMRKQKRGQKKSQKQQRRKQRKTQKQQRKQRKTQKQQRKQKK